MMIGCKLELGAATCNADARSVKGEVRHPGPNLAAGARRATEIHDPGLRGTLGASSADGSIEHGPPLAAQHSFRLLLVSQWQGAGFQQDLAALARLDVLEPRHNVVQRLGRRQ